MAWSAVTSAVTTIGNLLTQEAIYLWGVEEQVDRLQTELKWMQRFLMEAETKQSKDEMIGLWVAEIRELAYDTEDVVEEFALKIGSKNKGGLAKLKRLNGEESWELFQKIVFPQTGNYIGEEIKELGENMVKHCAGLPLAIVVLGGILATKNNSLNEWRKISDNVKSYLKRALSYDDLPPYLRPCFLYLSHFPEDYMIDVDRLIQLWVAEGIVSSKQEERDDGEIAEDVAESYLMELVERCMIQVRRRDVTKQENFVFIVDRSNASSLSMIRKVRRVSVHEFFFIQLDPKHLALIIVSNISKLPDCHSLSSNLADIKLSLYNLEEDPMPTLEKLANLRILKLVSFEGKEMFCSAQGFPKLESLSLSGLHNLKEWNVDEGAMPSLQRLEIWECRRLKMLPEGLRFITTLSLMGKTFKHRLEEGGEDFYKVKHVPNIIFHACYLY
ncbi:hypothetical protein GOBAR_DD26845 [Gossypium barbadense]|nr:hypothetical protein GOBAR_DD26845 [Gossypium barbadense]